jgi:hypothetical protein
VRRIGINHLRLIRRYSGKTVAQKEAMRCLSPLVSTPTFYKIIRDLEDLKILQVVSDEVDQRLNFLIFAEFDINEFLTLAE